MPPPALMYSIHTAHDTLLVARSSTCISAAAFLDFVLENLVYLLFLVLRRSHGHELLEPFVMRHQVVKCVDSLHVALLDPDNPVAAVEHVQLVCSQDTALVLEQATDGVIHNVLADVGIDSTERVVHEYNVGVKVNGSRDIHALLLTS
jgi:hypothetical protein